MDPTADWGYYIRDHDDDGPISIGGKRKLISKSGTMAGNSGVVFSGMKEEKAQL